MAATAPDFDPVFDRLKAILEPYAREMYVSADDDNDVRRRHGARGGARTRRRGSAPFGGASAT